MVTSFLLMAALLTAEQTVQPFHTGQDLVESARKYNRILNGNIATMTYEDGADVAFFRGYVQGFVEAPHMFFCIPDGVTMGQLNQIVVDYAISHPKRWNEEAALLVGASLIEAYPCKKK